MSDNWNPQSENDRQQPPEGQFNNSTNQSQHPNSSNSPLNNPNGPSSTPQQSGQAAPENDRSLQPRESRSPQADPAQPNQPQVPQQAFPVEKRPVDNVIDRVRGWTNKMAAITGHTVNPPAPPMERYQPSTQVDVHRSTPMNVMKQTNIAKKSTLRKNARIRKISRQMRQRRIQHSHSVRNVLAIILTVFVAIIIVASSAGSAYGYNYYLQQQPRVQRYANEQLPQITRIFDRNNTLLYQAYDPNSKVGNGGRRLAVRYQDIPKVMQDAMIAIEDKSFWTNDGIDPAAIIRAGASSYGGASTLTQQLIKNLSGDAQDTYIRKLNEAAMAIGMTQQYPKSTILDMYFNVAPFGSQDAGVEIAAQDYFGLTSNCEPDQPCAPAISKLNYDQKTGKNDPILGLARATLLASIPNSPVSFDPSLGPTNKQAAMKRQDLVLKAMMSQQMLVDGKPITKQMISQAETLTSKMVINRPSSTKLAPSFVDYVITEMETALGNGDEQAGVEAFLTGGYNIQTTVDLNLNNYSQAAIQRHLYKPELQKAQNFVATLNTYNNVNDGAVVVEDSKTGEILSMIGTAINNSRNPAVSGYYNAATSPRPPGSSFKPFDYSTAFEMGWNPGIMLEDTRTYFPNSGAAGTSLSPTDDDANANVGVYSPYDYGHTYWDRSWSVRAATANSFNIPAIRAMQYAGTANVLNTVQRLGITFANDDGLSGLAWAIGSKDVSLLQMVGAYQAFADQGKHVTPQSILNVWDNYGDQLYHYNENSIPSAKVFSPQVAYQMTSILQDEPSRAFEFTGDEDLSFADVDPQCQYTVNCKYEVAAKTGTTDNFRDNWTIGYTANAVVGVWVGNSDDTPMTNNPIGITGAAPIWHSVMERTMGWCNNTVAQMPNPTDPFVYADNVPCGPKLNLPFSNNPEWKFPFPGGISQGTDGLPSSAATTDWIINGN